MANNQPPAPAVAHRHTWLKLPKNNNGALFGAGSLAVLVAILELVEHQLKDGTLPVPPSVQPYLPLIVGVLGILVAAALSAGTPHYAPDQGGG